MQKHKTRSKTMNREIKQDHTQTTDTKSMGFCSHFHADFHFQLPFYHVAWNLFCNQ